MLEPLSGITANFEDDVRRVFAWLLSQGVTDEGRRVLGSMGASELVVRYLNWCNRMIQPAPRGIRVSREFERTAARAEYRDRVAPLRTDIAAGNDLTQYLSRRVLVRFEMPKDPSLRRRGRDFDGLLNDWGIHHLHLPPDGALSDDGPLLFAVFLDKVAYILDILDHGSFEDEHLFRIMVRNWPDDGLVRRLNGLLRQDRCAVESVISAAERRQLRGSVSTLVEVDGSLYISGMTGGVSTAGTSSRASIEAFSFLNFVRQAQRTATEDRPLLAARYALTGVSPPPVAHLRLVCLDGGGWGVADAPSGTLLYRIP